MNSFVEKYNDRITGVISCFDRMLFKGYLPIGWSDAMEGLLSRQGLLIKDFGKFVEQQSERLKNHAEKLAETLGRPFEYINGKLRKDNAFLWISDCERAQKFADRMETTNWPRVFSAIARRVNPLLKDVLAGMGGIQSFAVNRSTLGHGSGRVCHGCDVRMY